MLPLFDDDNHYQVNSLWHHQKAETCMIHILPLFYDDNHYQANSFLFTSSKPT